MNLENNFETIDLNTWPRGALFRFYINEMRIVMSLTVDIDVTPLRRFVKDNELKFYPTMIWLVSSVINAHDEFKYGWDDAGRLIKWETVSPSYAHFHEVDENFVKWLHHFQRTCLIFTRDFCVIAHVLKIVRAFFLSSLRIFLMSPACLGCIIGILICMYSMKVVF